MRDLAKLIVAKCFKKLPKVQKIAKCGHTASVAISIHIALIKLATGVT